MNPKDRQPARQNRKSDSQKDSQTVGCTCTVLCWMLPVSLGGRPPQWYHSFEYNVLWRCTLYRDAVRYTVTLFFRIEACLIFEFFRRFEILFENYLATGFRSSFLFLLTELNIDTISLLPTPSWYAPCYCLMFPERLLNLWDVVTLTHSLSLPTTLSNKEGGMSVCRGNSRYLFQKLISVFWCMWFQPSVYFLWML